MDDALDVLIGLLPRLWKQTREPFHTLQDEAKWWLEYLPRESRLERRLLDAAIGWLRIMAASPKSSGSTPSSG